MDCFGVEIGFLGEREGHGLPTCSPNEKKKILKNGVFIFVVSFFIFHFSFSLAQKKVLVIAGGKEAL